MTTTVFLFAIDQSMRRWSRLFLIHPETCSVRVSPRELTIHFGRWSLRTTPDNVADITITGPYRRWKVAGPAHFSLADRGVTFATSAERGVCVTFREPVAAIEPAGFVKHPAVTLTVADPERFIAALRHTTDAGAGEDDEPVAMLRQGTYLAAAQAVVRWTRRRDSVDEIERDVDQLELPPIPPAADASAQRFEDGVGPGFHRRFRVIVDDAEMTGASVMGRFQDDPNLTEHVHLAPFVKTAGDRSDAYG